MAVKKINEIFETYKELYGESENEKDIEFLEDITDTLNDYETRVSDSTNWKEKYETNDAEWKKRYRERFFGGEPDEPDGKPDAIDEPEEPEEPEEKPKKYEDLFKEGE